VVRDIQNHLILTSHTTRVKAQPSVHTRRQAKTKHHLAHVTLDLKATGRDGKSSTVLMELIMHFSPHQRQKECKRQGVRPGRTERIGFVFGDEDEAQIVVNTEPWKNIGDKDSSQTRIGFRKS
jgi:hypothetical protein